MRAAIIDLISVLWLTSARALSFNGNQSNTCCSCFGSIDLTISNMGVHPVRGQQQALVVTKTAYQLQAHGQAIFPFGKGQVDAGQASSVFPPPVGTRRHTYGMSAGRPAAVAWM